MFAFRADANPQIGTGHIMRCLSIAKALEKNGEEVVFITADDFPSGLLTKAGFKHVVLNTDWTCMEDEIRELAPALQHSGADFVLVDSYYITENYFKQVHQLAGTAYMDDFAPAAFPVDVLINYNVYADASVYRQMYDSGTTRLLLGPWYTPLREEFRQPRLLPIRRQIADILITSGGTDPSAITYHLAESMLQDMYFRNIRLSVAAGICFLNIPELKELSRRFPNLMIHEEIGAMSGLMLQCDAAISAGGTTLYELCACGTPSVIFGLADNQIRMREYFRNTGAMIDCGDFRSGSEACITNIVQAVKRLEPPEVRSELRKKVKGITDGLGADRLAFQLADCARQVRKRINCK